MSIERFFEAIRRDALERGVGKNSFHEWGKAKRRLIEIGIHTVEDLAAMDDDDLRRFLAGQHGQALRHAGLQTAYRRGLELGLLPTPQRFSNAPAPIRRPGVAPTLDDVQRWLDHQCRAASRSWEVYRGYALTATAAFTGLTIFELLGMAWSRVDLEAGRIEMRRGREMRWVDIPDRLREILTRWKAIAVDGDLAFPSILGGPWSRQAARDWLAESARAAGVPSLATRAARALRRFHVDHVAPTIPGLEARLPDQTPSADRPRHASKRPVKLLTAEQAGRFMCELRADSATWDGHRALAFAAMHLLSGMTPLSASELRREDVHLDHSPPYVIVTYRGRQSPLELSDQAAAILRAWLARPDQIDSPYVFPGARGGPWLDSARESPQFRAAAARAGITSRVTPVDLNAVWKRMGGKVDLGEAWRAGRPPGPIADGPRMTGRRPSSGRARAEARRRRAAVSPAPAIYNPDAVPAVKLGGPRRRSASIRGEDAGNLADSAYRAVKALLDVWPRGLTRGEMNSRYGGEGWRRAIDRLIADRDWRSAIETPGSNRAGEYRILAW